MPKRHKTKARRRSRNRSKRKISTSEMCSICCSCGRAAALQGIRQVGRNRLEAASQYISQVPFVWSSSSCCLSALFIRASTASFNCFALKATPRPLLSRRIAQEQQQQQQQRKKHSYFSKLLANCQTESRVTPSPPLPSTYSTRNSQIANVSTGCALLFYCLCMLPIYCPKNKMK